MSTPNFNEIMFTACKVLVIFIYLFTYGYCILLWECLSQFVCLTNLVKYV